MSWINSPSILLLALLSGCSPAPGVAAEVCPVQKTQPLRFVDVFDGPVQDLATLVPDKAQARSGYWRLGYVYDAARFVTIRCKYADGKMLDVKLSTRVERCEYQIDADKTLVLRCK